MFRFRRQTRLLGTAALFALSFGVRADAQPVADRLLPEGSVTAVQNRPDAAPFHTDLGKFRANRIGNDVLLEWITLREVGNRGFEVQRASSESRGWQQAGFVPGGGDGSLTREYTFRDRGVPPEDLRYMLRIIGDDGMVQYSQIVSVLVTGTLRAFVVRAQEDDPKTIPQVSIDLLKDETISLQLTDRNGNVLEHIVRKQHVPSGKHEFALECSRLPSGRYQVLLFTSEGRYHRPFEYKR